MYTSKYNLLKNLTKASAFYAAFLVLSPTFGMKGQNKKNEECLNEILNKTFLNEKDDGSFSKNKKNKYVKSSKNILKASDEQNAKLEQNASELAPPTSVHCWTTLGGNFWKYGDWKKIKYKHITKLTIVRNKKTLQEIDPANELLSIAIPPDDGILYAEDFDHLVDIFPELQELNVVSWDLPLNKLFEWCTQVKKILLKSSLKKLYLHECEKKDIRIIMKTCRNNNCEILIPARKEVIDTLGLSGGLFSNKLTESKLKKADRKLLDKQGTVLSKYSPADTNHTIEFNKKAYEECCLDAIQKQSCLEATKKIKQDDKLESKRSPLLMRGKFWLIPNISKYQFPMIKEVESIPSEYTCKKNPLILWFDNLKTPAPADDGKLTSKDLMAIRNCFPNLPFAQEHLNLNTWEFDKSANAYIYWQRRKIKRESTLALPNTKLTIKKLDINDTSYVIDLTIEQCKAIKVKNQQEEKKVIKFMKEIEEYDKLVDELQRIQKLHNDFKQNKRPETLKEECMEKYNKLLNDLKQHDKHMEELSGGKDIEECSKLPKKPQNDLKQNEEHPKELEKKDKEVEIKKNLEAKEIEINKKNENEKEDKNEDQKN